MFTGIRVVGALAVMAMFSAPVFLYFQPAVYTPHPMDIQGHQRPVFINVTNDLFDDTSEHLLAHFSARRLSMPQRR